MYDEHHVSLKQVTYTFNYVSNDWHACIMKHSPLVSINPISIT